MKEACINVDEIDIERDGVIITSSGLTSVKGGDLLRQGTMKIKPKITNTERE